MPKTGEGEREVADRVCPRVDGDEASHGKLVANPIQTKLGQYLGPHLLFFGTSAMASRIFSVMANPTLYSTLRPRTLLLGEPVEQVMDAPAPSERTSSFLRCAAGICAIASYRDVVGRSVRPGSPGSQHGSQELFDVVAPHPSGWKPKVFLKVGEA